MSAAKTALSIIVTSHNQLKNLKLTLLALLDQKPWVPTEILVADCGSTDGTGQFLEPLVEKGTIRVLAYGAERGRTAARNKAAAEAGGRHLMFLDPGILVGPGWWEPLFRVLEKDPQVAAVSGRILLPDGTLDHAGLSLLHHEARADARPCLGSRTVHAGRPGDHAPAVQSLQGRAAAGEALMTRATAFFSVGGFSARLGRGHGARKPDFAGDPCGVDLGLRYSRRGWRCVYQPDSIMTRLRVPGTDSRDFERDMSTLSRTWLDRIQADFRITAQGSVTPLGSGGVRAYVEPMLHPDGAPARGLIGREGPRSRPAASIILDAGDDLRNIRDAVENILAGTLTHAELILLDSGADPDLPAYLNAVAPRRLTCRLLPTATGENRNEHLNQAERLNQALAVAEGRHLVLMDGRARVATGWLEALVGVAEMNPEAGLVGPVTNGLEGMQQIGIAGLGTLVRGHGNDDARPGDDLEAIALRQMLNHSGDHVRTLRLGGFCLLIKREVLVRLGGLDRRFDGGLYEFNDYCLRAQMAGYQCLIARGCYVHQEGPAPAAPAGQERLLQLETQWAIFKRKWGIPLSTRLDSRLDLGVVLRGGFDPRKHFETLAAAPRTIKEERSTRQGLVQASG